MLMAIHVNTHFTSCVRKGVDKVGEDSSGNWEFVIIALNPSHGMATLTSFLTCLRART